MAIFSRLLRPTLTCRHLFNAAGSTVKLSSINLANARLILKRNSGHNTLRFWPSEIGFWVALDSILFWIYFWGIPLTLWSAYMNSVYGKAQLAEIPDGYDPLPHEYYRRPIERFLKKHFMNDEQQLYEVAMQSAYETFNTSQTRRRNKEIMALMNARQDYKSWFWLPVPPQRLEIEQAARDMEDLHQHTYPAFSPQETTAVRPTTYK